MPKFDSYSARERQRRKAYEAAYASAEAQAWIAGMTPDERKRAEDMGLLAPMFDTAPADARLDDMPQRILPTVEHEPTPETASIADVLTPDQRIIIAAYFAQPCPHPQLRQRCLCFLLGIGSGVEHAAALGMSRQRFDYHALKMQRKLNLPNLGFTRGEEGKKRKF